MARYFNLPVRRDGIRTRVRLFDGGQLMDEEQVFVGVPAEMWAVWEAPVDFRAEYAECSPEDAARCAAMARLDARPADADTAYGESLRPLVHFTPRRGFHNDPNGLLFDGTQYHMFFQLNPYGLNHGNTHWGWAVSPDMLHWTERELALHPSEEEGLMFSGSGVVDLHNTSGLQTGEKPPILLFYTATGMRFFPKMERDADGKPIPPAGWTRPATRQCAAVSVDGGESFRKIGCVVDEIAPMNRDPKVRWVEAAGCWVMALYLKENDFTLLYSSDLLHWERGQTLTLPNTAECPDLFELFVDDDPAEAKWVFFASPENYLVGHFDGRMFVPETELLRGPSQPQDGQGKTFTSAAAYAPQTFSGLPRGEEIQISWIPTVFPAMPFASCMSLPWQLRLKREDGTLRLLAEPIAAVADLREASVDLQDEALSQFRGEALDLDATLHFEHPEGRVMLRLRGVPVLIQRGGRELVFPTGIYPLPHFDGAMPLRILTDRGSVELFCGSFHCALNAPLDPAQCGLELLSTECASVEGTLYRQRPIFTR